MRLFELLDTKIEHHPDLNPTLWVGDQLVPEVREALLKIVLLFCTDLKVPELKIEDIVFTGSLANYNWSKYSDIDVHLIVDMSKFGDNQEIFDDYFMTKKSLWNRSHDITIKGYDVELYVEDKAEGHTSSGVFSIVSNEWLVVPSSKEPEYKENIIKRKARSIARAIDSLGISCDNTQDIIRTKDKIKKMRQEGLESSGEFSIGNLVYKVLRNNGYIEKLYDKYNSSIDACYSL